MQLPTLRVKGQDGLYGHVYALKAIALKHDLSHPLSVLQGVHGRLCEKDLLSPRVRLQLIEEGIVPELHHVFPVLDDTMF